MERIKGFSRAVMCFVIALWFMVSLMVLAAELDVRIGLLFEWFIRCMGFVSLLLSGWVLYKLPVWGFMRKFDSEKDDFKF